MPLERREGGRVDDGHVVRRVDGEGGDVGPRRGAHVGQALLQAPFSERKSPLMNHDFRCCLLDGMQKGVKIKICLKLRLSQDGVQNGV